MSTTATTIGAHTSVFPKAQVKERLRIAVEKLGRDNAAMREPWEPVFDSLSVVGVVLVVESILPSLKIPPEKVVRKGGYSSINETVNDIADRVERIWERSIR